MAQLRLQYSGEMLSQNRRRVLVVADGKRLRAGQQELLRGR